VLGQICLSDTLLVIGELRNDAMLYVGLAIGFLGSTWIYSTVVRLFILTRHMSKEQFEMYRDSFADSVLLNDPIVFFKKYKYLSFFLVTTKKRTVLYHLRLSHRMFLLSIIAFLLISLMLMFRGLG